MIIFKEKKTTCKCPADLAFIKQTRAAVPEFRVQRSKQSCKGGGGGGGNTDHFQTKQNKTMCKCPADLAFLRQQLFCLKTVKRIFNILKQCLKLLHALV